MSQKNKSCVRFCSCFLNANINNNEVRRKFYTTSVSRSKQLIEEKKFPK